MTNTPQPFGASKRSRGFIVNGIGYIPLNDGNLAIVDADDVEYLSRWRWNACERRGLIRAKRCTDRKFMHRVLLPEAMQVDHKDRNPLNNQRGNLRVCTPSQNAANRVFCCGTSKYKGVAWNTGRQKWEATIGFNGKKLWLGYCQTEQDAAVLYDVAAQIFFGEFSLLNNV